MIKYLRCLDCDKVKPVASFNKSSRNANGHQPYCRICQKEQRKNYSSATEKKYKRQRHASNIARLRECYRQAVGFEARLRFSKAIKDIS